MLQCNQLSNEAGIRTISRLVALLDTRSEMSHAVTCQKHRRLCQQAMHLPKAVNKR